jgi:hypothetical protein
LEALRATPGLFALAIEVNRALPDCLIASTAVESIYYGIVFENYNPKIDLIGQNGLHSTISAPTQGVANHTLDRSI